jgi:hypothetical protein
MAPITSLLRIRLWLAVFIVGLLLSGITAFPLESEMHRLVGALRGGSLREVAQSIHLLPWLERVEGALADTNGRYPFLAYGTDWLAFAHLVIAIVFLGPLLDPVRNKWVIQIRSDRLRHRDPTGTDRGTDPRHSIAWQLVDCSFGIFRSVPLLLCLRSIRVLERSDMERATIGAGASR